MNIAIDAEIALKHAYLHTYTYIKVKFIYKWKLKGMKYDQYVKNTVNEKTHTGLLQVSGGILYFQNARLERKKCL